ncbi:MAG: SRPBCC family protein [Actinomycetota bacterium]
MSEQSDPSATVTSEANGAIEVCDDNHVVLRFRRRLAYPPQRVWAALTEPAQLAGWWGDAEIDLTVGGAFVVRWRNTDADGNTATIHHTITQLEPSRLLETAGDLHGVLRWELTPDGPGTVLAFSSTVVLPGQYRSMVLAGWHWHLDGLAASLGGTPADLEGLTGWTEVHERYADPRARTSPFS